MSIDAERNEEPLVGARDSFDIPKWFRVTTSILAIALIVLPGAYVFRYTLQPERFVSPAELGIVQLVLVGVLMLVVALVPWRVLGLRIRKVGFVEFDQVVNTQANEHAQEFAEIRERIEELESRIRRVDDISPISEHLEETALYPLLFKFLGEFQPTAFSPIRIREWGARQPGYEKLGTFSQGAIRRVLQKLVAQGKAATRLSRMGNTLYKVVD